MIVTNLYTIYIFSKNNYTNIHFLGMINKFYAAIPFVDKKFDLSA